MADQRIRLDEIVDNQSITVDPITGRLRSTPINTVDTGLGILDPVRFFARPDSSPTPAAGITGEAARALVSVNYKTPEDFGAYGDDSHPTETTVALQLAITYCLSHGVPLMLTPNKTYQTNDMLQIGTGSAVATFYMGVLGACSTDQSVSAAIHATAVALPALNIQGARNVYLENIYITGNNGAPSTGGLDVDNKPDISLYVSSGLSSSRWSPHCGISIGALSGSTPVGGYSGKTYGQFNSIGIHLSRCVVRGFVVGIINFSTGGNGDNITYDRCDIFSCAVALAICETQCRANTVQQCNIEFCHTCLDTLSYGSQNGSAPTVIGGEWVCYYRAFNVTTGFAPLNVNGLYTESMKSLGVVSGPNPAVFVGCYIYLGGVGASSNPLVHGYISTRATKFVGCAFVRNDQNFLNFLCQATGSTAFESCYFITNDTPSAIFHVNDRIGGGGTFGRTVLRECFDGNGNIYLNEVVTFDSAGSIARPTQCSRVINTWSGTANSYLFDGDMFLRKQFREGAVPLAASAYVWTLGSVTFTAVAGEFLVGDLLYWKCAVRSSANPDAPTGYNGVSDSYIVALKVTVATGTSVTAVAQGDYQQLDTADAPASVYVAHNEWAALRTLTADLHNASPTMDAVNISSALAAGDFVLAAAGLPAIVRVKTVLGASSYTLSKNATANRTAEPIYCSKLAGV